ncbi:unnamed protein product [Camellia sinensis]
MGNAATSCAPSIICSNGVEVVKVLFSDGRLEIYTRPVKAAELMVENPGHFICDSTHLKLMQRHLCHVDGATAAPEFVPRSNSSSSSSSSPRATEVTWSQPCFPCPDCGAGSVPSSCSGSVSSSSSPPFDLHRELHQKLRRRLHLRHQLRWDAVVDDPETSPYFCNASANMRHQQSVQGERNCTLVVDSGQGNQEAPKDLRSRGLCLVPVSCTHHVGNDNGADYWAPALGGGF